MELSVSYNGDLNLIEKLKEYTSVTHIYGAPGGNVTGGGRSSFGLPPVTREDIEEAVSKAHSHGIEFNYLINSSCMGNKEFTNSKYKEIVEHLDWVESIGADWVTIANPYIMEICKTKHPRLKISLSSFAMVESVERAKFYDDMGVGEITVRENINRNFHLLENIQKNVKCKIQVLANQTCLYQCPYQFYHDNVMSHASQSDDPSAGGFLDYCLLGCAHKKFSNAADMIKACWIRPEDTTVYVSAGIDKFKITDRGKSTDWLVRAVKAYHERSYRGNLADILNIVQTRDRRSSGNTLKADSGPVSAGVDSMRRLIKAFALLDVRIDNQSLEGFIEHFKKNDCRAAACEVCKYCERVAGKVVSFPDEAGVSRALKEIGGLIDGMVNKNI